VGNTALDGRLLGAPDEISRRARLQRAFARVTRSPRKVWRDARSAYLREWETNRSLAEIPDAVAGALKRHAEALAPTVLPIRLLDEYVLAVKTLNVAVGIGAGLLLPQIWLDDPSGSSEWLRVVLLWLPLAAAAGALTLSPFSRRAERLLGDAGKAMLVAGLGAVWTAVVLMLDQWGAPFGLGNVATYALSAAALTAAALSAGLLLLILFYVTLVYVLRRVAISQHADSAFVHTLLEALTNLFFLDGRSLERPGFDPRREAVRSLEAAAVAAEVYLPRFLAPGDDATGTWLRERAGQWASALRAHKRWILTARARDEHAVDRLRATLRAAACGDWEDMERRPAVAVSRGSRLRMLGATTLRGATPLAAALVLREAAAPGFDGAIGDYAVIGSAVWLALSFLAQYDPLFGAKIGAAADISRTLRGG
jgi:hypothetical protein